MSRAPVQPSMRPPRQRGIVLMIVLIVMVTMALAGIALFRSVDTNVLIAGNLAFKQTTAMGTDAGIQDAIVDMQAAGPVTLQNGGFLGYAPNQVRYDFTGSNPDATVADYPWVPNCDPPPLASPPFPQCKQIVDGAGNTVQWVIQRMCNTAGDPTTNTAVDCVRGEVVIVPGGGATVGGLEGSTKGTAAGTTPDVRANQIYYLITTRVQGPRNSVTFAQAVVK